MASEACNEPHPEIEGMLCDKPVHPYGAHMHRDSMTVWAGLAVPSSTRGAKGARVKEIVKAIDDSGRADRTGPPGGPPVSSVKIWQRSREQWLKEATEALKAVCETHETFTNELVWLRVDDTEERRAMVLVTRSGLRSGWMVEDHAIRVKGTWQTRDGAEFPLNKLVPVYRSLIHNSQ